MAITLNQHKAAITERIITSFSDASRPKMGLSGFFPSVTTSDRFIGIEIERNRQLVAADVQRGADANMNTFSDYSEKLYQPPMYLEGFDFSSLDRYNVTFGERNNPSMSDAFNMINQATRKLNILKDKINRAIELQRSQALQTGIVTMNNGDNVNFKRKSESLKALTGTDVWSDAASSPLKDLEDGCRFLREEGLSAGNVVNAVLGREAFSEFMNNQEIKTKADIRNIDRVTLGFPQFDNTTGLSFHGQVSVFDFRVNIWTYSDFYEIENGVKKNYIDEKNVVLIAEDFEAKTAYAGVPAIMQDKSNAEYPEYVQQVEAEFYINNYVDPTKKAHMFDISSAPLAIPVSIDRVYTVQVLV
ncbi:major capsid protein [Tenacibaculum finnmarkense]|uniref:major capsid protein n=1 Tax=Tenacibaculum finnmarkense TaxID=2781243 RepID=UPI00207AFF4E|nr:major capsid protein [Tenacibaculum finnmarkense]MCM8906829.1 major capsid protein [Tenacibaculum finnmarkense genomovar finnmarkense]